MISYVGLSVASTAVESLAQAFAAGIVFGWFVQMVWNAGLDLLSALRGRA